MDLSRELASFCAISLYLVFLISVQTSDVTGTKV
jgi:hypothetical protein